MQRPASFTVCNGDGRPEPAPRPRPRLHLTYAEQVPAYRDWLSTHPSALLPLPSRSRRGVRPNSSAGRSARTYRHTRHRVAPVGGDSQGLGLQQVGGRRGDEVPDPPATAPRRTGRTRPPAGRRGTRPARPITVDRDPNPSRLPLLPAPILLDAEVGIVDGHTAGEARARRPDRVRPRTADQDVGGRGGVAGQQPVRGGAERDVPAVRRDGRPSRSAVLAPKGQLIRRTAPGRRRRRPGRCSRPRRRVGP